MTEPLEVEDPKNLSRLRAKARLLQIWAEEFPGVTIESKFSVEEPWKWFNIYANLRGKAHEIETTVKIYVEAIDRRNRQNHLLSETIHKQRLELGKRLKEIESLKSESKLTSGLRELAEKWRKQAEVAHNDAHKFNDAETGLVAAEAVEACADDLLALLPEATKEPHNG